MQKWRTGGQPPAATASVCGHHIKGETVEMTDSVDTTDTTTNTAAVLNSVVAADASLPTSHSLQEDNRSRKKDTRSSQELSSTQPQEVISREDADLTITDAQTGTESGCADSEMGCTETTKTLKREHSHSPCSQSSPLQSPTTVCRAIGCIVEPEQELVVHGEASQGGQREERQPRKRVKRETMEEERKKEGSNGLSTSMETPAAQPDTLPLPPSLHMRQDRSTPDQDRSETEAIIVASPQSPPPATTRGAPLTHARPTSLPVSPQITISPTPAMPQHGGAAGEDRFPSSEEERTPDGGTKEFVGHSYYSPLRNNGEMVTPEKRPTPPNTVIGHWFPLQRMLSVDNNTYRHTYYSYALGHAENRHVLRITRQNSEPTRELYGLRRRLFVDNNGRLTRDGDNSRRIATL